VARFNNGEIKREKKWERRKKLLPGKPRMSKDPPTGEKVLLVMGTRFHPGKIKKKKKTGEGGDKREKCVKVCKTIKRVSEIKARGQDEFGFSEQGLGKRTSEKL